MLSDPVVIADVVMTFRVAAENKDEGDDDYCPRVGIWKPATCRCRARSADR